MNEPRPSQLEIDAARFEQVWRLSTYIVGSLALEIEVKGMELSGLKPNEYIVFRIIAQANVQRHMREHRQLGPDVMDVVPTPETNVSVSRRRITDASGLPRETVRRIVNKLVGRGLVQLDSKGALFVPIGTLRGPRHTYGAAELLTPVLVMLDRLVRLGVLRHEASTAMAD